MLGDAVRPSTPEKIVVSKSASNAAPFKSKSNYDDQDYIVVLLQYQHERMERLRRELKTKKLLLDSLTLSVAKMENEVFQKKKDKMSTLTLNDLTQLRNENRQIKVGWNCMVKEIESLSKSGYVLNKKFHEFIGNRDPPPPPVPPVESEEDGKWSCSHCTFLNHMALNKCEMCEHIRKPLALRARQHRN